MANPPTLVFIPGSWHKPACYDKIIRPLRNEYNIKCVTVTLPSTMDNPNAGFKDDIEAAREAISSETTQGHNVIVIAHSYGGMVGNSAIKGFTRPTLADTTTSSNKITTASQPAISGTGFVTGLILIASGFTLTGLAFMDPFFGIPPPSWRIDRETGYAVLVADPHEFFYHDVPDEEVEHWVSQLTTQSLKALFEDGEYAYAGWQDVPTWYVGTLQDRGLPVILQRVSVGMARSQGAIVHHVELNSSHSPFLSLPDDVVDVILDAVRTTSGSQVQIESTNGSNQGKRGKGYDIPMVRLSAPVTWFRYGIPFFLGRLMGWSFTGIMALQRLWKRK